MTTLDLERVAAAIHHHYLDAAQRSQHAGPDGEAPAHPWSIDPAVQRAYDALDEDAKDANRAAARRITGHLALIDLEPVARDANDGDTWKQHLEQAIEQNIDRLAIAEHDGWCEERRANGWTYAQTRDNERKHHPSLTGWENLSESERDKDRSGVRAMTDILDIAGYKAVPVKPTE